MCWSCNPMCGSCRPPRQKAVKCTECATYNVFDIEIRSPRIPRLCKKCGTDLTESATPVPVECKRSGRVCANPCRKYDKPAANGELVDCKNTTVVWSSGAG